MKKCIIIGAGDFTLPGEISCEDLVIAADGGYDHAKAAGIEPKLFVGDSKLLSKTFKDRLCLLLHIKLSKVGKHIIVLSTILDGYTGL